MAFFLAHISPQQACLLLLLFFSVILPDPVQTPACSQAFPHLSSPCDHLCSARELCKHLDCLISNHYFRDIWGNPQKPGADNKLIFPPLLIICSFPLSLVSVICTYVNMCVNSCLSKPTPCPKASPGIHLPEKRLGFSHAGIQAESSVVFGSSHPNGMLQETRVVKHVLTKLPLSVCCGWCKRGS